MVDELLLKIYGRTQPLAMFEDDTKLVATTLSDMWYSAIYSGPRKVSRVPMPRHVKAGGGIKRTSG